MNKQGMRFKLLLLLVNAGAMYLVYQHDRPDSTLLGVFILFCTYIYLFVRYLFDRPQKKAKRK